jgi:hypothetical protein
MEAVAAAGRPHGIFRSAGTIASIEKGSSRVTLEMLIGLSLALGALREKGNFVEFEELIKYDGRIQVGDGIAMKPEKIVEWLSGGNLSWQPVFASAEEHAMRWTAPPSIKKLSEQERAEWRAELYAGITPTEERLAKKVDRSPAEIRAWAIEMWGHGIEEERDHRAGDDATAQKKGRVTRTILNEVLDRITESS